LDGFLLKITYSLFCDYSNIYGWISLLWAKKNENNLIFWLDSTYDDRKHYFPKEQIKQFFLKYFDIFIAPGNKTKQYLEYMKVDGSKIITTGYSVNTNFFIEQYQLYKNTRDILLNKLAIKKKYNFIFIGRFAPEKNIFTLLESFLEISKNSNEWGLLLLGDGPLKEDIISFITDNELEDKIQLPGFIQQDEIVKYFIVSNVFILPSLSEPWGLVVNEAMLCSMPVIVSNRCGCETELVNEGVNGFSFDPLDTLKLQQLMESFTKGKYDIELMGRESLRIVEQHSPKIIASIISNKLHDLEFD